MTGSVVHVGPAGGDDAPDEHVGRRSVERLPGAMAVKLRGLAEKASIISIHAHPLPLQSLSNLEMIDSLRPGEIAYEYDGSGSFYCQVCLQLGYNEAHHCRVCHPPFDVCLKCFKEYKEKDLLAEASGELLWEGETGDDKEGTSASGRETTAQQTTSSSLKISRSGYLEDNMRGAPAPQAMVTTAQVLHSVSRGNLEDLLYILFATHRDGNVVHEHSHPALDYLVVEEGTRRTLLHYAAQVGSERAVFGLLMHTGNKIINARDRQGLTALMIASMYGRVKVVEELLYGAADTELRCGEGYTALMLAAAYGFAEVAARLIHGGADVNSTSFKGRTALAIASLNGHAGVVKVILQQQDTVVNIRDNEGYTPLLLGASRGHQDVIALFSAAERKQIGW